MVFVIIIPMSFPSNAGAEGTQKGHTHLRVQNPQFYHTD